jgi:hypothetical protein
MIIKRFFTVKVIFFMGLIFFFLKIYSTNKFIKLQYEKQRLEREKKILITQKNNSMIELVACKNYECLQTWGLSNLCMTKINLDHVITYTR